MPVYTMVVSTIIPLWLEERGVAEMYRLFMSEGRLISKN